jgi:hypothetical protein
MESTRQLMRCQVMDRARGSFYVNPLPVRGKRAGTFRASNHISSKGAVPHQNAIDYRVVSTGD